MSFRFRRFLTPTIVGLAFAAGCWTGAARPQLGAATAALQPVFTSYATVAAGKWQKVAPGLAIAGISHSASADFAVVQLSSIASHTHHFSTEYGYVVSGTGKGMIGGKSATVKPGDIFVIPPDVAHSFVASGPPFRVVMVSMPPISNGDMHMTKTK